MSEDKDPEEMSDAELAQTVLDSADTEDLGDLEGRVFCSDCGSSVEFDMEQVFEYVLRKEYGLTVKALESRLDV